MRTLAGSKSTVKFTHLSRTASKSLSDAFLDPSSPSQLLSSGDASPQNITGPKSATIGLAKASCLEEGIMHLLDDSNCGLRLENVCLLDPKAETELSPEDGDGRFAGFLFGVSGSPNVRCIVLFDEFNSSMSYRASWVRVRPTSSFLLDIEVISSFMHLSPKAMTHPATEHRSCVPSASQVGV